MLISVAIAVSVLVGCVRAEAPQWCGRPYSEQFLSPPAPSDPPPQCHVARSFFTDGIDKFAAMLVSFPPSLADQSIGLSLQLESGMVLANHSSSTLIRPGTIKLEFPLVQLPFGSTQIECHIGNQILLAPAPAVRVLSKDLPEEAVLVDFTTGGLAVNGLPFFVTSFYTRWPFATADALQADTQHVHGFNTIAPYSIPAPADNSTIEFLDRCAAIGMKVQYHLTGLTQDGLLDREALKQAVRAVRDHPAILSYYIADEPDGPGNSTAQTILRDQLVQAYKIIKAEDPFHPVSLVLNCLHSATRYLDACDILMTDPYCIGLNDPVGCDYCTKGVLDIETRVSTILDQTAHSRPLWLVNQAFGGGEHWRRTPSRGEHRAMVYLGIYSGIQGMQAFAYEGLWPRFGMWAELQQLSQEIATMSPFLLSTEAAPNVTVSGGTVRARAWRWQCGDGATRILVVAVNPSLSATQFSLQLQGAVLAPNASAVELFEDLRSTEVLDEKISDMLGAYGSRAWLITEAKSQAAATPHVAESNNLQYNPSFELAYGTQCPDFGYQDATDRGSSWVLDTRLSVEGLRSMRLTTTQAGKGVGFSAYAPTLQAGTVSFGLHARAAIEGLNLSVSLGSKTETFKLTRKWTLLNTTSSLSVGGRNSLAISLTSAGVAWVDAVHVSQLSTSEGEEL